MTRKLISLTLPIDLLAWTDEQVKKNVEYRNRSHMIETLLTRLKQETEKDTE